MADFEIIDASDAPAALRRTGPNERAYEALVAAGPGKVLKVPMAGKKPDSFISRMHFLAKKRGRKIRCRQVDDAVYVELIDAPRPLTLAPYGPSVGDFLTPLPKVETIASFPGNGDLEAPHAP